MKDLTTLSLFDLKKYVEDSKKLFKHIYEVYHLSASYCAIFCCGKLLDEIEDILEEEVEKDEE